jgi:hypothetical protein
MELNYTEFTNSFLLRIVSVTNTFLTYNKPWAVFTTLHYIHNLHMGPTSIVLDYTRAERLASDKNFSLLGH